jgi:hypothetical protein
MKRNELQRKKGKRREVSERSPCERAVRCSPAVSTRLEEYMEAGVTSGC